jgi:hypothetical protein
MSDHVHLYGKLVESLPKEALDPKVGVSKPKLEELIKHHSHDVVKEAKHISCAKKARKLMRSISHTAHKRMKQVSGRWFISKD